MYDLELKHNSSLQVLYLNPLGNFDFSLAIPGYEHSQFVKFRLESEEDFELCTDISQSNYLDSVAVKQNQNPYSTPRKGEASSLNRPEESTASSDADSDQGSLLQTAQFRFVKQKKLLL